jgi:hypothetical protein
MTEEEIATKAVNECIIPLDFIVSYGKQQRGSVIGIWDFLTVLEEHTDPQIFKKVLQSCEYLVDEGTMFVEDGQYLFKELNNGT